MQRDREHGHTRTAHTPVSCHTVLGGYAVGVRSIPQLQPLPKIPRGPFSLRMVPGHMSVLPGDGALICPVPVTEDQSGTRSKWHLLLLDKSLALDFACSH